MQLYLEMVHARAKVTTEHEYEIIRDPSNGANANDLE